MLQNMILFSNPLQKLTKHGEDGASICSQPGEIPAPFPKSRAGCLWKRGPVVECPR